MALPMQQSVRWDTTARAWVLNEPIYHPRPTNSDGSPRPCPTCGTTQPCIHPTEDR